MIKIAKDCSLVVSPLINTYPTGAKKLLIKLRVLKTNATEISLEPIIGWDNPDEICTCFTYVYRLFCKCTYKIAEYEIHTPYP